MSGKSNTRVRTAVAAGDMPLPAHPAPFEGDVARLSVSDSEPAVHACDPMTALVELRVRDASVRVIQGDGDPMAGSTRDPGYHSFSVRPGATLRFQSVSGEASVEVMEG